MEKAHGTMGRLSVTFYNNDNFQEIQDMLRLHILHQSPDPFHHFIVQRAREFVGVWG